MNCPAREKMELHFESALTAEESASIAGHAASCESCGAYLRRLNEEAQALKRNLPDVAAPAGLADLIPAPPASNPWKPLSFLAMAACLLLTVGMLWQAKRTRDAVDATRQNVQAQIRFHLDNKEPQKAVGALSAFPDDAASMLAADEARVEIAAQCDDDAAARLLDDVDLAGKEPAAAQKVADARLAVYERLFAKKILQNGQVPTPYEPEHFRLHKQEFLPHDGMMKIVGRLLLANDERRDLAKRCGTTAAESEFAGLARITQYAIGDASYGSIHPATEADRIAFGDVLYRERQFDRAIEVWKPVMSNDRVYRKIAELAAFRRLAPKTMHLWDYDVDSLLGRDKAIEAEATARITELLRRAKPIAEAPLSVERRGIPQDTGAVAPTDEPVVFFPGGIPPKPVDPVGFDPEELFLLVDHRSFQFEASADRPFFSRGGATLALMSAYRGPIRARLYRVADLETFSTLTDANFVERRSRLSFVKEWEQTVLPLWSNDVNPSVKLDVPPSGGGLFVVIADARYCPVYAVTKFVATDAALVQQVASDRVLVFAVDRGSGAPQAGLALAGEVTGEYAFRPEDTLPWDDSNADEFKRGFETGWAKKVTEPDAGPSWRRGYQRAKDLRLSQPDVKFSFSGSTDKDGLFEWKVAESWRAGYSYRVATRTTAAETYSRVESGYAVNAMRVVKDLVYSDRPLYRPGDKVSFKAMLRVLDNEGLQPWGAKDALFEFGTASRTLFAKSYEVSDFGTADGSFDLPYDIEIGLYWVRVNNGAERPLFKVEEYRKPDFQVILNHPAAVKAGAPVVIDIAVRTYSGDPVPNASVDLVISAAPLIGRTINVTDAWYGAGAPAAAWHDVERRTLKTDESGLCSMRFLTDAGAAAQYSISAMARDLSRREVSTTSRFEASALAAAGVVVETDRPIYYPGERAMLRIRADGAAAVRIEERKEMSNRFSTTVELQKGLATLEYVVPAVDSQLCVGVRNGDEWAWSPVTLRIAARPSEGALAVRPDKSIYKIGETAKIVVRAAERDQFVLVEIGTGAIHQRQVVRVVDRELELSIKITGDFVPNITVVALAVRGDQLLKATGNLLVPPTDQFLTVEVATDKGEYRPGEECRTTIRVVDAQGKPVSDCEISLGVVDESIYALQEDRTPDLREFFHRYERKLAYGESFFFQEKSNAFVVWKTLVFVKGLKNAYDSIGIGGGAGAGGRYGGRFGGRENLVARGGGTRGPDAPRSDFRDTATWEAVLRTNAEGVATATFSFPDSLSTFRFTARGITRDAKVGEVRQHAVVRKPFYTRLAVPRVVQEGNQLAIAAMIHNATTEPQVAHVAFKSSYPVVRSTASESIAVMPGAVEKVEYLVSVDRYLHDAAFEFKAWSDSGLSDGISLTVPGHRHGAPHNEGRSGTLTATTPTEEVFRVPDGAIPGSFALKLNLDAGVHAAVIEGLEPLIEYPYGCIEQTMSRFFPAAVASKAIGQAPNRWSEKLPAVMAAGLRRVYSFQHNDGSWGWFGRDGANDGMTAYVVYGLSVAKKSGMGVDKAAVTRGAEFLRGRMASLRERTPLGRAPLPCDLDKRVYIVLALSEFETAWGGPTLATKRLAGLLAGRDDERSATDEVMLAIACRRLGMTEEADRLAKRVEKRPLEDVATAALTLQLQAERGGELGETLRFLLSRRQGKGWRTTIESAYAILGLSSLLERAKPGDYATPGRVTVDINGKTTMLDLPSNADPKFDGRISVPEPAEGWRGKVIVRLTFDGTGVAFYTASLIGMLGGEDRPAVSRGIEISREYYEEEGNGWRLVADGQLHAGRPVLVRLTVTSPDVREYVMITDARADGFEPRVGTPMLKGRRRIAEGLSDTVDLADGWQARLDEFRRTARGDAGRESAWAKALLREIIEKRRFKAEGREEDFELPAAADATVEHRDDRTIFFVDRIAKGETNLYYVVRPELAGSVHALAATAAPMYEPEVFGAGVEDRLTVVDERVVAAKARELALPPGVKALLAVIDGIGLVDADAVIAMAGGSPRIGELLLSVVDEKALRAWLTVGSGSRSDLATRMLCAQALGAGKPGWRQAIQEAMSAPATVEASELNDGALQWIREDRAFRLALLTALQRIKGSARLDGELPEGMTLKKILAAAKNAPTGDALVQWKLSQRLEGGACALSELLGLCEKDLGLPVKVISCGPATMNAPRRRTVAECLDEALNGTERYWKVRDGAIVIGTLDELNR